MFTTATQKIMSTESDRQNGLPCLSLCKNSVKESFPRLNRAYRDPNIPLRSTRAILEPWSALQKGLELLRN